MTFIIIELKVSVLRVAFYYHAVK